MALYALHLCKASYCVPDSPIDDGSSSVEDPATVLRSHAPLRALGFELYSVYVNASYGTLAYAGVDHINQRVLAVFRGSANLQNWLSDLTFWSEHYPCPSNDSSGSSGSGGGGGSSSSEGSPTEEGSSSLSQSHVDNNSTQQAEEHRRLMTESGQCRIHRGFYEAYRSLAHNLLPDLLLLHSQYPRYAFLLTGHSLGGALAYICGLDLLTQPASPLSTATFTAPFEVYTFGEPRSGNLPLNEYAAAQLEHHPHGNRKHFRLTHGRDPVPHLPPMSWGYLHQPQELWYYRNGTEDDNPFVFAFCNGDATSEDPMCSNSVWSTTVSDHLWYMGTCTHCVCIEGEGEETENGRAFAQRDLAFYELQRTRAWDREGSHTRRGKRRRKGTMEAVS